MIGQLKATTAFGKFDLKGCYCLRNIFQKELMSTNISHGVSPLSQFSSSCSMAHCTAVKHLLKHVKGSLNCSVSFGPSSSHDPQQIHVYAEVNEIPSSNKLL